MTSETAPSNNTARAERLGWLTESSVQPRKRRAIEGVGTAGLVDLKASLYRQEEQARLVREGVLDPADTTGRRKAGIDVSAFARRNAGVEARDKRDKEQLTTPDSQLEASRSALERKAALYERLAAVGADDDDEDLYNVDFMRKEPRVEEAPAAAGSYAAVGYVYGSGDGGGARGDVTGGTRDSAGIAGDSAQAAAQLGGQRVEHAGG